MTMTMTTKKLTHYATCKKAGLLPPRSAVNFEYAYVLADG